MHITHWVPSSGKHPSWNCVEAWMKTKYPPGCEHDFVRSKPGNIEAIWNEIIKDFLKSGSDYLFSTHEDVEYHPNVIPRLLSWDKPLISALVFMRHSPVVPHIWHKYEDGDGTYALRVMDTIEWFYKHNQYILPGAQVMEPCPEDALAEVTFTSTACTLIHRSVLEAMQEFVGDKWFVLDHEINGGGEDRRFHEYARMAGFPGYVDRSCVAGHMVGDVVTSAFDFVGWFNISDYYNTGEPGRYQTLETANAAGGSNNDGN
jgi:hypothetical protein